MVGQQAGSSRPKESSIDVVMMALYSKIFSSLSGFFGFLLTPIRASRSEEFWAAKEVGTTRNREGIDLIDVDAVEVDFSDDNIEAVGFKFFFDSEDFVKGVLLFGVSDFEGEGEELDFWFWDLFRESSGRAIDTDLDIPTQG